METSDFPPPSDTSAALCPFGVTQIVISFHLFGHQVFFHWRTNIAKAMNGKGFT
jgi:hypothetical protein